MTFFENHQLAHKLSLVREKFLPFVDEFANGVHYNRLFEECDGVSVEVDYL